ncbi:MAG: hypothetical protein QXF77_04015 [Candidatus Jordarchaeales archaeon]
MAFAANGEGRHMDGLPAVLQAVAKRLSAWRSHHILKGAHSAYQLNFATHRAPYSTAGGILSTYKYYMFWSITM